MHRAVVGMKKERHASHRRASIASESLEKVCWYAGKAKAKNKTGSKTTYDMSFIQTGF